MQVSNIYSSTENKSMNTCDVTVVVFDCSEGQNSDDENILMVIKKLVLL